MTVPIMAYYVVGVFVSWWDLSESFAELDRKYPTARERNPWTAEADFMVFYGALIWPVILAVNLWQKRRKP